MDFQPQEQQEGLLVFEEETPKEDKSGPKGNAIASMILGILSIELGTIPGIILACIARAKSKKFLEQYPESSYQGFARVGRITGNIGLPLSIVTTVLTVVYTVAYVVMVILTELSFAFGSGVVDEIISELF